MNSTLRWSMGGCGQESQNSPIPCCWKYQLTVEELTTEIEACLNSRPPPLGVIPNNNDDGIEVLTPGHFLIGRPIEALPDQESSHQSMSMLRRWYLCESLVRHFWIRWSNEYLIGLRKYSKWRQPTKNLCTGDVVVLREDEMFPTHVS